MYFLKFLSVYLLDRLVTEHLDDEEIINKWIKELLSEKLKIFQDQLSRLFKKLRVEKQVNL